MQILRAIRRRLIRPWMNEAQRLIVARFNIPQTVMAEQLGEVRFRVQSASELSRTVDYGNELTSLAAFLFFLTPDDIVWDIGASVGLFTVHCAARCSRVVAFEPDPATFSRLKENVELNGFTGKVRFEGCAVGDKPGVLELATDGLTGFAPVLAKANLERHRNKVDVPVETIDNFVQSGVPAPTVVKMDIEGAEILALRGGRLLLSGPSRPRLLFIEIHPQFLPQFGATSAETERLVEQCGYRLLSTHHRAAQYHLIAVRSE